MPGHVYHLYVVRSERRDSVLGLFLGRGKGIGKVYIILSLTPATCFIETWDIL